MELSLQEKTIFTYKYLPLCIALYALLCMPRGTSPTEKTCQVINIAKYKPTSSSSVHKHGQSGLATDGIWYTAISSHTNMKPNEWLAVDLGRLTDICKVKLLNKKYFGQQLSDATVGLLDTMPSDGDTVTPGDVDVCGTLPSNTQNSQLYEVTCDKTGRVVVIQHQTRTDYVAVSEVLVYEYVPKGTGCEQEQLTLSKTSAQINELEPELVASYANDGILLASGDCANTNDNTALIHWWAVNLGRKVAACVINILQIYFLEFRDISNAIIGMMDEMPSRGISLDTTKVRICNTLGTHSIDGELITVTCALEAVGSVLVVYLPPGQAFLTLCEVQLFEKAHVSPHFSRLKVRCNLSMTAQVQPALLAVISPTEDRDLRMTIYQHLQDL